MPLTLAAFGWIDWTIVGMYLVVVMAIGIVASRGQKNERAFFLANRAMPTWAVSLSILATALSAATFIGAPQTGFTGNLTYLILNIGSVLGVLFVALVLLPPLYRAGTTTIYGFLEKRFGPGAMIAASAAFLIGRLLASGTRLFMAGIAFSLILFGSIESNYLITAICLFGVFATTYVAFGGIKAVIWTDVIQIIIVVGAAILSVVLLLQAIPLSITEIFQTLQTTTLPNGQNKLQLYNGTFDLTQSYTLWGALAMTFFNAAAFGVDQDLTQRMLTTKSPWRASVSLIVANLAGIPIVLLFLIIGLLLSIYYGMPQVMGDAAPTDTLNTSHEIYPQFLANHLPTGLAGLAMVGMFAAAMSSLDSAVNAMASSLVCDLYLPWQRKQNRSVTSGGAPRLAMIGIGILLTCTAVCAASIYNEKDTTLIDFALRIMIFAYAGLLGVFLTALLTKRGNSTSVILALITGAVMVSICYFLKPLSLWISTDILQHETPKHLKLAFPYWMVVATTASFLVCYLGNPKPKNA